MFTGVALEHGGTIRIEKNYVNEVLPEDLPEDKADNRILMVCKGLVSDNSDKVELYRQKH